MGLGHHVTISILTDSVGASREGFGVPLILSHNATFPERIRFYTSLAGVAVDFPVTTSPEYLAATALFSQPGMGRIAIGRAALKPTLAYTLNITAVRNSHTYRIQVAGQGFTGVEVTYTSDATATDGEIAVGLVAALNAVVGKNFTAAGATSPFTVTGNAAGNWFSLEVDPADIKIAATHADPGVATDLAAILVESKDWYTLYTMYNSNAYVVAAAAWVEANKKTYLADINESESVTLADGGSDTLDDLQTAGYNRTMGCYHPSPKDMFGAAWMGSRLWTLPGSETWKYAQPVGPAAVKMTETHRTNLTAKNGNSIEEAAGVKVTFDGKMASGEWFDTIRGLDWLENEMQTSIYEVKVAQGAVGGKVPFTNKGIASIESAMRRVLKLAVTRGVLSDDPAPTTTVPLAKDVPAADKANRKLTGCKFNGTLAGAVHETAVTGVVS